MSKDLRNDAGGTDNTKVWRRPTRRAFVAMLGAAAALLAVRDRTPATRDEPPRSTWTGTTRWIGHF